MVRNGRSFASAGVRSERWSSRLMSADAVSAAEEALAISCLRREAWPFLIQEDGGEDEEAAAHCEKQELKLVLERARPLKRRMDRSVNPSGLEFSGLSSPLLSSRV